MGASYQEYLREIDAQRMMSGYLWEELVADLVSCMQRRMGIGKSEKDWESGLTIDLLVDVEEQWFGGPDSPSQVRPLCRCH